MNNSSEKANKTVLVGMTGRLDSTVAAYLLKKQGYKVIGISLITMDRELIEKKEEGDEFQTSKNKTVEPEYEVTGSCYVDELKKVQRICEQLDIGFYGVDAKNLYQDLVVDYLVSSRLSGIDFNPCIACNSVKIQILLDKAKYLKADYISTGHYAKIFTNLQTGECSLLSANDEAYDQSFFLSALTKDQLKKILLPFGDIRRVDVEKIAKSLEVDILPSKKKVKNELCFNNDHRLGYFIEKRSPVSLREEGTIVDYYENITHGEHNGIYNFKPGDDHLITSDGSALDKDYKVLYCDNRSNIVYVTKNHNFLWNRLNLSNCVLDDKLDISKPISVYILVYSSNKKVEGRITIREGTNVIFECEEVQKGLLNYNRSVTIYDSNKIGAKILGYGKISAFFHYEKGLWRVYPEPVEKAENTEEQVGKKAEVMEF